MARLVATVGVRGRRGDWVDTRRSTIRSDRRHVVGIRRKRQDRFRWRVVRLRRAAHLHRSGAWLVVADRAARRPVREAWAAGALAGAFASRSRWRTRLPQTAARRVRARDPR